MPPSRTAKAWTAVARRPSPVLPLGEGVHPEVLAAIARSEAARKADPSMLAPFPVPATPRPARRK